MKPVVFIGPTIAAAEARTQLDARFLPPAAQGDVLRAARGRPPAIGLVDGYFDRVPAVWHKEILWALTAGVHVFGAASMGALRAAELAPFGMRGVGWIFACYRAGVLEDDDEVAVAHAPAEAGFAAMSEAMVNIRCTLAVAQSAGVLRPSTRSALEWTAKDLFYADRHYPPLLARAGRAGAPADELDRFREWLPAGRVDRKRLDAIEMLAAMRDLLVGDPAPPAVRFRLAVTDPWRALEV
jgi:hypothetical protein